MDAINESINAYDLKISELAKEIKKETGLGYGLSKKFESIKNSYYSNKDLLSSEENGRIEYKLKALDSAIKLKFQNFPDISLNVFYGGLMGSLLEFSGLAAIFRGVSEPSLELMLGGITMISLGASIQAQRIYSNVKHSIKVKEALKKAE